MNIPLSEYPRPQLARDSYLCLNGQWDLRFLSDEKPNNPTGNSVASKTAEPIKILVPYSPESEFSGVGRTLVPQETMLYSRHVEFPDVDFSKERLLLHFGAVDYRAIVFIDKEKVFEHIGGYLPFTIEVFKSSFDLDVSVQDPGDSKEISRGKQSSNPGGIWYPQTSGIWQTVWMEKVPKNYIQSIKLDPDLEGFYIEIQTNGGSEDSGAPESILGNSKVPNIVDLSTATMAIQGKQITLQVNTRQRIDIENAHLWSPDDPFLYNFDITYGQDIVHSYVGLRTFGVGPDKNGVPRLLLNGRPYFHHGLLDQGYFKGGYYTPKSDADFVNDILRMKKMGFNTLRKHIKIEPLRWYYHCDCLGMLVWQDMVSGGGAYRFWTISAPLVLGSFLDDTRYDKFARTDKHERDVWEIQAIDTIHHLYNCTSIAMWVPFNEGWGQFDSKRIVSNILKIDTSRTIDHASGWHDQGISDVRSLHVYFHAYHFKPDKLGRAVVLSEFGGYGMNIDLEGKKAFTYRNFRSKEDLTKAIVKLYNKQIIPAKAKGLAASIYTQVSDVEQEVNGLLSYDRAVVKVDAAQIARMSEALLAD